MKHGVLEKIVKFNVSGYMWKLSSCIIQMALSVLDELLYKVVIH